MDYLYHAQRFARPSASHGANLSIEGSASKTLTPIFLRQLRVGDSVRNAAKITGKGVSTVQRIKLAIAA